MFARSFTICKSGDEPFIFSKMKMFFTSVFAKYFGSVTLSGLHYAVVFSHHCFRMLGNRVWKLQTVNSCLIFSPFLSVSIYGGVPKHSQREALKR